MRKGLTEEQVKEVALKLNKTLTQSELSEKFGVSNSAIMTCAASLRKLGVNIPYAHRETRFSYIAAELRKTNPELFTGSARRS